MVKRINPNNIRNMSLFKKIILAIDDKVEISSKLFEEIIIEIIENNTTVQLLDELNVPLVKFREIVLQLNNIYKENRKNQEFNLEEAIYQKIEENFDNYVDEIYDILEGEFKVYAYDDDPKLADNQDSWESKKMIPTIFY